MVCSGWDLLTPRSRRRPSLTCVEDPGEFTLILFPFNLRRESECLTVFVFLSKVYVGIDPILITVFVRSGKGSPNLVFVGR